MVDREARERFERHRWIKSWRPILDKVYGPAPPSEPPADMEPDHAPLPGPRTRRAVERELAGWELSMAVGRLAMARHQQRQPHALLSFIQLTRLLQIAFDFGRLTCGLDACQPDPPVIPNVPTVHKMLARAHGHP